MIAVTLFLAFAAGVISGTLGILALGALSIARHGEL